MDTSSDTGRMDEDLERGAKALLKDTGMNMPSAINISGKAAITGDPFHSEANQERIEKSIAQLNAGKGTEHALSEDDDG